MTCITVRVGRKMVMGNGKGTFTLPVDAQFPKAVAIPGPQLQNHIAPIAAAF